MRFSTLSARPFVLALGLAGGAAAAGAQTAPNADPRVGLGAGWTDAKEAASNVRLVGHVGKTAGFADAKMGDFATANSDLAFSGNYVFQGNFNGFQIWDVSKPG